MRPAVVWFGEELDSQMLKRIQQHIARDPVDLCIVIGTSGTVYPAAGYVVTFHNVFIHMLMSN